MNTFIHLKSDREVKNKQQ